MIEVCFVHVPKTGGATFREILAWIYGDLYVSTFEWEDEAPEGTSAVAGHFTMNRAIELFPDAPKVTFLRHPVDRIVSNYRFLKRTDFPVPVDWIDRLRAGKMSLLEYTELDSERCVTAVYVPLETLPEFEFIGFQEHYQESIDYFLRKFDKREQVLIKDNGYWVKFYGTDANGYWVWFGSLNVSGQNNIKDESIRKYVANLNPRSMAVYQTALDMWKGELGI